MDWSSLWLAVGYIIAENFKAFNNPGYAKKHGYSQS